MNPNQFKKTLVDIVLDYLQDQTKGLLPGYFKNYFYGDPVKMPLSLLPCVVVEKQQTDIQAGPIQSDTIDTTIAIKLMYNKRNDFGTTTNEVVGVRMLEQYAEAIDPATNSYSEVSVMGILRKYFTLADASGNYNVLDSKQTIRYGIVPRPDDVLTAECQIICKFHQLINIPGRQ